MSAPAGYIRAKTERERVIDRLWLCLRRARKPLSAWDLAERAGASRSQAKHLIQAARDAGWLEVTHDVQPNENGPGATKTALYRMKKDAPTAAPVLRRGSGRMTAVAVAGETPVMTGEALVELRRARGWTAAAAGEAIGVDPRTVRRYEMAAVLPPEIAARVRDLRNP